VTQRPVPPPAPAPGVPLSPFWVWSLRLLTLGLILFACVALAACGHRLIVWGFQ
jgi:hypothetical protein